APCPYMATQPKVFYLTLNRSESASADEIKKSYRKLAKQYHPDANANDAAAAERFKEISEAYSVLSDDAKRKQYDEMRKLGAFGGLGGYRPGARPGTGGRPEGGFTVDDLDIGGLGGIFGSLFHFGERKNRGAGPPRREE